MNFELKALDVKALTGHKADALILLIPTVVRGEASPLTTLVAQARKSGDLAADPGKVLTLWRPTGWQATRVVLASVGEGQGREIRKAVTAAMTAIKGASPKTVTVWMPDAAEQALTAAAQAVSDAAYVYTATKPSAKASALQRVCLALPTSAQVKAQRDAFEHACAQVAGVALAREWGNRPANHATPTMLSKAAQALAKHHSIRCEVLGPKEIAKLGMGSFAAVAQGSHEPARFIVLHYQGDLKSAAPVVLVGKSATLPAGVVLEKSTYAFPAVYVELNPDNGPLDQVP